MRRMGVGLLTLVLVGTLACTPTLTLSSPPTPAELKELVEINEDIEGERATVVLKEETFENVTDVLFGIREIAWETEAVEARKSALLSEVQEVLYNDRGLGAAIGLAIGASAGILYAAWERGHMTERERSDREIWDDLFLFGKGLGLGCATGAIVGGIKGVKVRIRIELLSHDSPVPPGGTSQHGGT